MDCHNDFFESDVRKNKWAVWSLQLARNRIFLHEFSAQSTIIIVIYMKEAINAPIVESLLSNQDKIPSLLWVCAQWFRVSLACLATELKNCCRVCHSRLRLQLSLVSKKCPNKEKGSTVDPCCRLLLWHNSEWTKLKRERWLCFLLYYSSFWILSKRQISRKNLQSNPILVSSID